MIDFTVTNRTAIVTGAAQGIGYELARTLAEHGADVAIFDLPSQEQAMRSVAAELEALTGRKIGTYFCDVTDEEQCRDSVAAVVRDFGGLDILVNNAGYITYARPEKMSLEEWNKTLAIDLTGTFLMCKSAANAWMLEHGGKIINITSISGFRAASGSCVYAAVKAAANNLTQSLALSWGRYGIYVNAIAPGSMSNGGQNRTQSSATRQKIAGQVPLGRPGRYGDMGGALLYLASDANTYTQGDIITVDGGLILPAY